MIEVIALTAFSKHGEVSMEACCSLVTPTKQYVAQYSIETEEEITLHKPAKYSSLVFMILLLSAFTVAFNPALAQGNDAQVIIFVSPEEGGTTTPVRGAYSYAEGEVEILTAIPNDGYEFAHWIIEGGFDLENVPPLIYPIDPNTGEPIDIPLPPRIATGSTYESMIVTQNPLAIVCGYGYTFTYKAVFIPTSPTDRSDAVVVVKEAPGGTTNPKPGTYTFAEGSSITLKATANEGFEFQYWTAAGTGSTGHPTIIMDNPLAPTCGIGYTYEYQPVFAPEGTTAAEGIPLEYLYATIIVLAVLAVIGIGAALMYRSRGK